MDFLNPSGFGRSYSYGNDRYSADLAEVVMRAKPAIEALADADLITKKSSFGFAMVDPTLINPMKHWDSPYKHIGFIAGWGDDMVRYAMNAVRKIRPLLREGFDSTFEMRRDSPDLFIGDYDSVVDGKFPVADFGYGGARQLTEYGRTLYGGVSALSQKEDHDVSGLLLALVSNAMNEVDARTLAG